MAQGAVRKDGMISTLNSALLAPDMILSVVCSAAEKAEGLPPRALFVFVALRMTALAVR